MSSNNSTPISQPPGSAQPNPPSAAPPRVNLSDIFTRFRNYGEHVAYIIALMFAFGIICANVLSFIRPGSYILTNELDILFPDDITRAPYLFDASRGMVNEKNSEEAASTDANKNWLAKWILDFISSPWPYSSLAVNIKEVTENDNKSGRKEVFTHSDTEDQSRDNSVLHIFGIIVKELIGNSLYFSYGNGRYLLKKFFRRIALFVENKTLVASNDAAAAAVPETHENIPYITNLMCFAVPIIISFLSFVVMLGWGPITTIIGSIANITYTKPSKGESGGNEYVKLWSWKKGLSGFLMLLVIGAFTILPIAISSYTIQPFMLFIILLIYPIASNFKKFTDIFLEIVPTLMLGFVVLSIMAAFHDLDQRVAIFLAIFMSIAYFKIFSEKIDGLRSVIAKYMAGSLVFGNHG